MKKGIVTVLKSIGFVSIVHSLTGVIWFLESDSGYAMIWGTLLYMIAAPIYFFLKRNVDSPWLYLALTCSYYILIHIISVYNRHLLGFDSFNALTMDLNMLMFFNNLVALDFVMLCVQAYKNHRTKCNK